MKVKTLILLFLLLSARLLGPNVYVLSIGIADYPGDRNDLLLPVTDAIDISNLYKSHYSANTKLLINSSATRQSIIDSANLLFAKAKKNDTVVIFFSGHGYPGGFVAYDTFLEYDDIKDIFSICKSRHKMVFADACYSGTIRGSNTSKKTNTNNIDVLLFLSSRNNEASIESADMKNGFFTTCLIKCLKGGADLNRDRIIWIVIILMI